MASLRECVRQHIKEIRDGIYKTIIWKNGRGWEAQTIKVNEYFKKQLYIDPKDSDRMREILNIDPHAIAINIGDYNSDVCAVCDDGSISIDTIARGIRSDYDNQHCPLSAYYDYVMREQREKIEWMRSRYNAH